MKLKEKPLVSIAFSYINEIIKDWQTKHNNRYIVDIVYAVALKTNPTSETKNLE